VRARLQSMSSRSLLLVAGAVVLVYAAAVWMLMVSPKRADAASAKEELAAAESRLELAQAGAQEPRRSKTTPVADVFRLARAMPSSADQPGIVIEISRLARQSGVTLRTLTVQDLVAEAGGPALVPVTVTVTGSYGKITRFLARTRTLVTVRGGKIHTKGRLFVVGSVGLAEAATDGFPKLDATIALDAFVYDGPIVPPDIPAPEEELPVAGTEAAGSTD
jgi:Tfp pilus assembly protein PilO